MNNKIKVGMIGAGLIGPIHIEALRRLGFVEVVALATSSEQTAKAKARELFIPKAYGDYRSLIEDKEVEVIHITSPNYLHFPQAKAVLEAGKHIVCDKPLAINSQQTRELVQLAEKSEVVNSVAFNCRFFPPVWQARSLIRQEKLGDIYMVWGGYHQDRLLREIDYDWRVEEEKGGPLRTVGDIGTHWLDIVQFVTGLEVESVFADLATFIPFREKPRGARYAFDKGEKTDECEKVKVSTEDYAALLLAFKNSSARGAATFSQMCAGKKIKFFFEVFGSRSSLTWNEEKSNELWRGYRDKPNALFIKDPALMKRDVKRYARYPAFFGEGYPDSFVQYLRSVYEYLRDKKYKLGTPPDFPTFQDGHKIALICEAIAESAKQSKWVRVKSEQLLQDSNL